MGHELPAIQGPNRVEQGWIYATRVGMAAAGVGVLSVIGAFSLHARDVGELESTTAGAVATQEGALHAGVDGFNVYIRDCVDEIKPDKDLPVACGSQEVFEDRYAVPGLVTGEFQENGKTTSYFLRPRMHTSDIRRSVEAERDRYAADKGHELALFKQDGAAKIDAANADRRDFVAWRVAAGVLVAGIPAGLLWANRDLRKKREGSPTLDPDPPPAVAELPPVSAIV